MSDDLYPLADGYLDGAIEERAWVPVALASTPEAALEAIAASSWADAVKALGDDHLHLVATGRRSWHRPEHPDADPVESEGFAWLECEPGEEGAVEFWDLIVDEAPA